MENSERLQKRKDKLSGLISNLFSYVSRREYNSNAKTSEGENVCSNNQCNSTQLIVSNKLTDTRNIPTYC